MHGYFVSLKLYDAARVIANPYVYEEHRARNVQEKLEKLAESRIRARPNQPKPKVKVNKAIAEKIARDEERQRRREQRQALRAAKSQGTPADVDGDVGDVVWKSAGVVKGDNEVGWVDELLLDDVLEDGRAKAASCPGEDDAGHCVQRAREEPDMSSLHHACGV